MAELLKLKGDDKYTWNIQLYGIMQRSTTIMRINKCLRQLPPWILNWHWTCIDLNAELAVTWILDWSLVFSFLSSIASSPSWHFHGSDQSGIVPGALLIPSSTLTPWSVSAWSGGHVGVIQVWWGTEAMGILDALILQISLIRASIKLKYPNGTSSRWLRDSASNGFSNAPSSCRLHFSMGPSRQVSSSMWALSAALSMVAPVAVSRLGIVVSWVADSWLDVGMVALLSWLDIGTVSWLDVGAVSWLDIGTVSWLDAISVS